MQKSKFDLNKGMSYAEVTVSFFVLSMFIMPICTAFVGATSTLQESRSLQQATLYSETLLDNVQWQLDRDITEAHEIEYNRLEGTPAYYLSDYVAPVVKLEPKSFTEVFECPTGDPVSFFEGLYFTERYAYEVAVWDLEQMLDDPTTLDATTNTREIGFEHVDKAYKWYTHEAYKLDQFDDLERLPSFKLSDDLTTLFQSDSMYLNAYTANSDNASDITGVSVITLAEDGGDIIVDQTEDFGGMYISGGYHLKEGLIGRPAGEGYNIVNNDSNHNAKGLVIIDARGINFAEVGATDTLIRIRNRGTTPIVVKVLTSWEDMRTVDRVLNLMCVDDHSGERINMEYVTDIGVNKNYLIGLVVRDLQPTMGVEGKIVKTMFDVYTYTP